MTRLTLKRVAPLVLWFILAGTMVTLIIVLHPSNVALALAFLAWCGGVVSFSAAISLSLIWKDRSRR